MSELPILYEDDALVAVNKPSGLLVHRSWIAKQATEFALQIVRDQVGQRVYPIHRLDRPTSGILLFAKSSDVARLMSEQFSQRSVTKTYHAVVRGYLDDGVLDYPLREELDKIADAQADQDKAPQSAVTEYQTLQHIELPYAVSKKHTTSRYSLVRLHPLTGRKHQLRRHMAHLRHPIVGDSRHGDNRHNRFFKEHYGIQRLWLAATGLEFAHPLSAEPIALTLPIPPEFLEVFAPAAV